MTMYQLTPSSMILLLSEDPLVGNLYIPMDEENGDYRAYLVWLSKGNTPLPWDWGIPPVVPPTPAENTLRNAPEQSYRIASAQPYVTALNDAIDLGVETAAEAALLLAWKQYRVDVWRTDISVEAPAWPAPPAWPSE